jgi:hypothetical protein
MLKSWNDPDRASGRAFTKTHYGIAAGLVGAALAVWQWRRRRSARRMPTFDRGEVIFSNTPLATEP